MLLIALALFCIFSFALNGFLSSGNLLTLVRSVSTLGILGVGMAVVVIGRGIDLTIVTIYAMSAAWMFHLANTGASIPLALALGYLFALAVGVTNGLLIAYLEISRSFRDFGHGRVCLWLRAFLSRPALCGVHAPQRLQHCLDWRRLHLRRADADPVFCFGRAPRFRLPALHKAGPVHLRDRRQFRGGADLRRSGASDHRPAIRGLRDGRLPGRPDHRDRRRQHEHRRRRIPR